MKRRGVSHLFIYDETLLTTDWLYVSIKTAPDAINAACDVEMDAPATNKLTNSDGVHI